MPKLSLSLPEIEPDPVLLDRMHMIKRACIGATALIAFLNLCVWLIPGLACAISGGGHLMKADSAFASLLCAIGLWLPDRPNSAWKHWLSLASAALATLQASAILIEHWFTVSLGMAALLPLHCGAHAETMSAKTAARFALLGVTIVFIRARPRQAHRVADLLVFCLCLLVLVSASDYLFGALPIFGLAVTPPLSFETVACLVLLTFAALFCRAEDGIFSIFAGQSIGGRIARVLAPILLILPFLREAGRAHLVEAQLVPVRHATAILTSVATTVSFALLLFFAWYIHSMEIEIRDLSLRDDLTGLYNLRGFTLLAEQALRMARRSQLPFSVLYIDFDNLKQINDALGHDAGSAFLIETGKLIKATFRETDVLARIGGDEFAVAGHFSHVAISIAAQRLETACAAKSSEAGARFPFSLSVGYVTAAAHARETLKELLTAADQAMYEQKRMRKVPPA